jgi:hypothetical protein
VLIAAGLLVWEHRLVKADDLSKLDAAFFTMNGVISMVFFTCVLAATLLGRRCGGRMSRPRPIVLAITGASGAPYAVRLLEALAQLGVPTWLIVSSHGWRLLRTESGIANLDALKVHVGPDRFDAT